MLVPLHAYAGEVNPVAAGLAKRLESKQACIDVAIEVGERLLGMAQATEAGMTFGHGPAVYDGDAGVALLFVGLFRATKDERWLGAARKTLDHALSALPTDVGLYTGRAGVGEACLEAFWATGEKRFLEQATTCVAANEEYPATDLISGAAGAGIFLLNLHAATGNAVHLAKARAAADFLMKLAVRNEGAAHWPLAPARNPAVYLGFSHGAAGVGYFLLHVGRRTQHAPYTELAEEAARFVLLHEDAEGEERAHWWRTVPKSSDDRRIQWCHGAPGIGLFFHSLHRFAPRALYSEALERCLETTRIRGRNARVGGCQCHGVAGNAELFLEVHATSGKAAWLEEARRSGSSILVAEGERLHLKQGQGGPTYGAAYMLGLAGIGHFFLRLADPARTPLPMMVKP